MKLSKISSPLTVDGISLGQCRGEVDRLLGCPATNANPCWARYHVGDERPLLVGFRALWPQDPLGSWVVDSLSGSSLWLGERLVARVGSSLERLEHQIGAPKAQYEPEPGVICYSFSSCFVYCETHSGRVVEIRLQDDAHRADSESLGRAGSGGSFELTPAC